MIRHIDKVTLVVHISIGVYATAFWIQIGALPYVVKQLGADSVIFGYIQTAFAVMQLIGGPFFGRFGDLYGGRASLVLAFASSALTYMTLGVATSLPLLFLSRAFSAFMHAMQGGQMVVTDMADEGKRSDALGKLGFAYGVGMCVGSVLGGQSVAKYGAHSTAMVAAVLCFLSAVACHFFLPSRTKRVKVASDQDVSSVFNVKKFYELCNNKETLAVFFVRLGTGFPISVFQAMFSFMLIDYFKLTSDQNGNIMAYVAVISLIVQGVVIRMLLKRWSELQVLKMSSLLLILSYGGLAAVTTVTQLCVVLVPLCAGLSLVTVLSTSVLTKTVAEQDTGAMLGMNMALNSLMRTVAPTIGGYLLRYYGLVSFGGLGMAFCSGVTVYLFRTSARFGASRGHVSFADASG